MKTKIEYCDHDIVEKIKSLRRRALIFWSLTAGFSILLKIYIDCGHHLPILNIL